MAEIVSKTNRLKNFLVWIKSLVFSKAFLIWSFSMLLMSFLIFSLFVYCHQTIESLTGQNQELDKNNQNLTSQLITVQNELEKVLSEDQLVRNNLLEADLKSLKEVTTLAINEYEQIVDLNDRGYQTKDLDSAFADTISSISNNEYSTASAKLEELKTKIASAQKELAAKNAVTVPAPSVVSNDPPGKGYSRQQVTTDGGNFTVSLIAGDLSSTRVIVDTASTSDCGNDCPVLPLAEYVSRNGGYAGINGSYFCPATYPSCAGKTNSFDLLVMNKDKTYFNSDNNVYSNNPAVIFLDGSVRFVGAASGWGRDTSPSGVLSNYPLLLSGGNITFSGGGEGSFNVASNRSFVANKGNTVYIGVVHGATVAQAATVLKSLGMENAMNLDSGGSTALWSGGYKAGPGRNIPNAIIFVAK